MPRVFKFFADARPIVVAPAAPPAGYSNTYSLLFGGTDEYVAVAAAGDVFSITNKFSISCWFKWVGTPAANQGILSYEKDGNENQGFRLHWADATTIRWDPDTWHAEYIDITVSNVNNWHHICCTADGTNTKVYLDGVQTGGDQPFSASIVTATSWFAAGRHYPGNPAGRYATGNIDEVAVWNKDLTSAEVTTIYNGGSPQDLSTIQAANLKLWWRMGDGDTYPTISDSSGTGNTGTMQNMESGDIVADVP